MKVLTLAKWALEETSHSLGGSPQCEKCVRRPIADRRTTPSTRSSRVKKMFVLVVISDTIVIPASRVYVDVHKMEEAIRWRLEAKYCNKVIPGSGLVIKIHELLAIGYHCSYLCLIFEGWESLPRRW
jgi:hypothetical protein